MNILLPIETINREIDFKLVLASLLADKSHSIFIGQHDFVKLLLPKLKNGLYIGKNIFHKRSDKENGEIYKELKSKIFDIIYLHEEGAVFKGNAENWKKVLSSQYNLDFFDAEDVICDWGSFQKNFDESRSQGLRIEVTGHPRFDLYKKKWNPYFYPEVAELKNKYGDFILVNGNYSTYNHGLGLEYIFSEKANYNAEDIAARLEKIDFIKYTGNQCLSIVQLTHKLAAEYPEKNIVFRPHPSENQHFYETIFSGVSNIQVKHDGSVSAWILASEAVIHDGCTTALEASIAEKPVINFKPVSSQKNDIWLPNQLGVHCTTFEEVKRIIDKLNNYNFDIEDIESKQEVKDLMYNFENDSYAKLLAVIEGKIEVHDSIISESPSATFISFEYSKMNAKKKLYRFKDSKSKKASEYHTRKFYGFDQQYIDAKLKILEEMLSKKIDYIFHNPYLIEVR